MKKLLLILLCLPMIGFGQTWIEESAVDQIIFENGRYIYIIHFTDTVAKIDNINEDAALRFANDINVSQGTLIYAYEKSIYEYDRLLNRYYDILKDELCPEQFRLLREAQRGWLQYLSNSKSLYTEMGPIHVSSGMSTRDLDLLNLELNLYKIRVGELIEIIRDIDADSDGLVRCNQINIIVK
jgi:uncharacterized protein YecT (DUF1311 family)